MYSGQNFMINTDSIMKDIVGYSKTNECKKEISDTIKDYIKNGSPSGSGNSNKNGISNIVAPIKFANDLAKELIQFIRTEAISNDIAESIIEDIDSFEVMPPIFYNNDRSFRIEIVASNNLSRESLYKEGYPDGISNIIALINNGYSASRYAYGVWHDSNIRSLKQREGAMFMQRAVNKFMNKYGRKYNVDVILNEAYEQDNI